MDTAQLKAALAQVPVVLNDAGPFKYTAKPMIEACLATKTHYLDITGEIDTFAMARGYDAKAKDAGIMLMPGTGFDVVPTDCLAKLLHNQLPDATHLQLAFDTKGDAFSVGTIYTMIESLGEGGLVRENGKLIRKPLGHKGQRIDFGAKKSFVMTIPWGDVYTAYYSTGIPNIEVFTGMKKPFYNVLKFQLLYNWFLKLAFVKNYLRKQVQKNAARATEKQLEQGASFVWGAVTNDKGISVTQLLSLPSTKKLTAIASLAILKQVLEGNFKIGFQTPSMVYGGEFVLELEGVKNIKNNI
ncbi:MAG: saccharopine dehydrogenase NADP-binding domain-containing protein [Saprospiraceae bacterium]|nr:saccharopine dehydrogenase NADP-binding domain-containing protein [Saprospiraceae bacterium]